MRTVAVIAVLLSVVVLSQALVHPRMMRGNTYAAQWASFKKTYGKTYASPLEETKRFGIFAENMQHVQKLNTPYLEANEEPVFGITQFSDLTPKEFAASHFGYKPADVEARSFGMDGSSLSEQELKLMDAGVPSSFQWPSSLAGSIENQEDCGGCWAFSTSQVVASQMAFQLNTSYLEMSAQQILDCDTTDSGCNGGDTITAYAYIIKAGGLESWSSYPFIDGDASCKFSKSKIAVTFNRWEYVMNNCGSMCSRSDYNVTELQAKLMARGPLSICVDAGPWQFYSGGVLSTGCPGSPSDLDHCVSLEGWGTSSSGKPYWVIKNQWGASWGINGYIYILASSSNVCGVMDEVTRPLNLALP